jgi:hypothetical protein
MNPFTMVFITLLVLVLQSLSTFGDEQLLVRDYYKETCPMVEEIVRYNLQFAVLKNPRMAASLLRLHFHDCFVMVRPLVFSNSVSVFPRNEYCTPFSCCFSFRKNK